MTELPCLRAVTTPAWRNTANCCDMWEDSSPTSACSWPTESSRWASSSRMRMRAGCPSVLKNSAFSLYSGAVMLCEHPDPYDAATGDTICQHKNLTKLSDRYR